MTACGNGRVYGFYKNGKRAISVGDSILVLEGKSRSEIKEHLDSVYGDSFPSMATVENLFNEFQRGRMSVFDELSPGAPKTATTEDNVNKIHDIVLADRRLKVREITATVGISKDCVGHILHEILDMKKLSGRDGCHVCSLRTTSATVRPLQSSV